MSSSGPQYGKCRHCRQRFERTGKPGRKQEYCTPACRRRAQRERSRTTVNTVQPTDSPLPLARNIAESVQALADGLMAAEYDEQDLAVLLGRAAELTREVEYYVCAAVHDARIQGAGWDTVAAAAAVSTATARSRWAEKTVRRRLERRASERSTARQRDAAGHAAQPRPDGQEPGQSGERPSGKLAAALSHLHRGSGLTIREVADRTELSASYVSRILSGERVPAWPVVETLAALFGGDPDELAVLWENAQGLTPPARQALPDAAARLNAALRGLYLAAASPSPARIHEASGGTLSETTVKEMLGGRLVPDWKTTVAFVRAVGGTPADIRPLWEAVHYAFLVFLDPIEDAASAPLPSAPDRNTTQAREGRSGQDGPKP
ncbi:helix-turn-helix transcriptional regulator [Streptomyces plumbiresistens]|uniref:HTH cro/C1-type domain-containing protein n=1 Tax=Streptomyces plumbiresistens TaxID=511811 RepID=A0ABP7TJA0_9ACTN